ncbi:DUF4239 domain-containing protein [Methylocystis parvus]|uniref:DUF4239 domain-containing protein n=1 Tax=Methylocystis parvus TaxID=134 RepID=A0A6B8M1W3_9HYPH|nr:DUF4239 domain-containing protein [Methylocystis parvus]QGM96272.1 DUF4239 domain-containing protein [Methylocystis parvus]WBJ99892.1 DUF4239 domain-containing protein [Methylocystis parvus OBBP]
MLLFLCSLPLWLGAFFIVVIPTTLAMLGPILVRKRYSLSLLVKNNEIAGFTSATVGVIYAVILAFAVVAVWDKFAEAEALVLKEAGAAATLYRISAGDEPNARGIRTALDDYLTAVVEDDWPQMALSREGRDAARALDKLYSAAMKYSDGKSVAAGVEIMQELGAITEARRGRLHHAMGVVPPALWLMLVLGALLTVGFTYFFGLENVRSQVTMTGGLSTIVFLGLFVIVSYDHPFTGEVSVEPHPIKAVFEDFHAK